MRIVNSIDGDMVQARLNPSTICLTQNTIIYVAKMMHPSIICLTTALTLIYVAAKLMQDAPGKRARMSSIQVSRFSTDDIGGASSLASALAVTLLSDVTQLMAELQARFKRK